MADTQVIERTPESTVVRIGGNGQQVSIASTLPILPIRNVVVFPGTVMPLNVGRPKSKNLLDEVMPGEKMIGVVAQKQGDAEDPSYKDLNTVGVAATILKLFKLPDGNQSIIVHGITRFRLMELTQTDPFLQGRIEVLEDAAPADPNAEVEALVNSVRQQANRVIELSPNTPDEAAQVLNSITNPSALADFLAANLQADAGEKQKMLEELDVEKRLRMVAGHLANQLDRLELQNRIQSQVRENIDKSQRRYFLQEQMKAIRKELGEGDASGQSEAEGLRAKLEAANLPELVLKEARRELARLESIPSASPEYGVVRTWLQIVSELPWAVTSEDHLDLKEARNILDRDHHDLDKVKRRIIEYLAVLKLKQKNRAPAKPDRPSATAATRATGSPGAGAAPVSDPGEPAVEEDAKVVPGNPGEENVGGAGAILCFVGPPGVGKTSLGKSIAEAMGRKFIRVALGGVRDEADIRGHRRTYIGSMPGRIIAELRKAGTRNPVMMLDEIDKLGADFRGDPASALLEVLDPAQNHTFTDHYLDVPFDLSKVLFIATANTMDTIPGPLRDRMEVIEIPGYTQADKLHIAKQYLVPRQLDANGLTKAQAKFKDDALSQVIEGYTREAGVRNLERNIGSVIRGIAAEIVGGETRSKTVSVPDVETYLGPRRFEPELAQRTSVPGVATGMAYTPVGGDILFIEATRMPGKGSITLTGQIGDVMKESATAAWSLVRSRSQQLGIDPKLLSDCDIHVHVPAGAIPKDGPSAGVAMFTALASLLLNRPVKHDLAMTGEITLRGLVLPIGGLKEKTLAAKRAGIRQVVIPSRNRKDLPDIPEEVRNTLKFHFVENIDQVLEHALGAAPRRAASPSAGRPKTAKPARALTKTPRKVATRRR
jgi:ATP-dependent Lon protease